MTFGTMVRLDRDRKRTALGLANPTCDAMQPARMGVGAQLLPQFEPFVGDQNLTIAASYG